MTQSGSAGAMAGIAGGDHAPDHDVRAVLRITAFRRLWLALGLSSFGDWLGLLALSALAKTLAGDSYAAAGFAVAGVFVLRLAPAVVLGPLAGVVADRLDRRWTMVVGDLLRFALFASIPLVGTLTWVYVATVLIECVALFWLPAKDATVPNLVPRNRLEAANQVSLVTTYGTAPLAAVVFSVLSLLQGVVDNLLPIGRDAPVQLALWVNAVSFLVSALTILRLEIPPRPPGVVAAARAESMLRQMVDGWRFVAVNPVVRGLVLGMLGAFAAAGFVIGLAPLFVDDLGAGDPGFGVLFGAVFVGLAVGMWTGPRLLDALSRRRLFGIALATAGVCLVFLAVIPNIVLAALFTVALGAGGGVAWVTGYTLLGLEVDDVMRGRTFAFLQTSSRVVLIGVLAVAPAIAALIGTYTFTLTPNSSVTYNGAAVTFLLAGVLATTAGIVSFRAMDDRRGVPLGADLARAWRERPGGRVAELVQPVRPTGFFVVVEGGDSAGKSTQVDQLQRWLADAVGHQVVVTREPGGTEAGRVLRDLVLTPQTATARLGARAEALLYAADRAHHVATVIRPALDEGSVVVCDRYVDSSLAYQGAGRALDPDEIAALSRWATRGLVPDLTVVLDIDPALARARRLADGAAEDRLEAMGDDFHDRVRTTFLELATRDPRRYLVVDAAQPPDVVADQVRARMRAVLPLSERQRAEAEARLLAEATARQAREGAETAAAAEQAAAAEAAREAARETARRAARERALRVAQETARRQAEAEAEAARRRADEHRLAAEAAAAERAAAERAAAERAAVERAAVERAAAERAAAERAAAERETAATAPMAPVKPTTPPVTDPPERKPDAPTRPLDRVDLADELFGERTDADRRSR